MRNTRARRQRLVRGAGAAVIATFIALMSHLAAGGDFRGWLGIIVPLLGAFVVCVALAGKRLALWRVALAVTLSQFLFHALFVLGFALPLVATGATSGDHHHTEMVFTGASTMLHVDTLMSAGHLVAAVLTTAALYLGERCLRVLIDMSRAGRVVVRTRLAFLVAGVALRPHGPRFTAESWGNFVPVPRWLSGGVITRGPPLAG